MLDWGQIKALPVELKALVLAGLVFGIFVLVKAALARFKKVSPEDPLIYRVVLSVFARKTRAAFYLMAALYVAMGVFYQKASWFNVAHRIFFVVSMVQLWIWSAYAVEIFFERRTRQLGPADISKATSFRALSFVANMLLIVFIVLFTLDNFGVNISALVAGLGVGGIAIALAVQNILGDLFASVTIILDKPFVVGDLITVGEFSGHIENIGVKTTRVRSQTGEQVIFSNADLLQSRIRNFKRLFERRVLLNIGVTYETPLELVERIPGILKEIVEATKNVRFERAHFKAFGASSLDYELVYFVQSSEYLDYMDRQQSINLAVARKLAELGVDFAYPTTTMRLQGLEPLIQAASETRKLPL